MIWHLDYKIDKEFHTKNFWDNYDIGEFHPKVPTWWRIFKNIQADNIISDLNLEGLNVFPRYSYQFKNTLLPAHIDEDEIIGVNFNLMPHPITIHLLGEPYEYETAVVDVGHVEHSVQPAPYNRLVLKFAIRAPLEQVLERINETDYMSSR